MVVINKGLLEWFGRKHGQAKEPLKSWLKKAQQANWKHLMDVRQDYPSADGGVKAAGYTVFNIKGNSYRLVTLIDYLQQTIFVTNVFTHAEYDKWNKL